MPFLLQRIRWIVRRVASSFFSTAGNQRTQSYQAVSAGINFEYFTGTIKSQLHHFGGLPRCRRFSSFFSDECKRKEIHLMGTSIYSNTRNTSNHARPAVATCYFVQKRTDFRRSPIVAINWGLPSTGNGFWTQFYCINLWRCSAVFVAVCIS